MSTDQSVDIAVDNRSIIGRYSVDITVDSRSTLGRDKVDSRSIVVPDVSRPIKLFVHRYFTDTSPTFRGHFADSWSILD